MAEINAKPSDFALHMIDHPIWGLVATDTETSGLFADDGARTSTSSIAFEDASGEWREFAERYDNVEWITEEIVPGYEVNIISSAWPFDQGVEGKEEDTGQGMLWAEAENLDSYEWRALLGFLESAGSGLDFHNAKFDLEKYRVGVRRWPGVGSDRLEARTKWDSQNVADLLWRYTGTSSLKPTCHRLWPDRHFADEAEKVKKYLTKSKLPAGRWDLMPWSIIGEYAQTDARITKMLELRQKWEIEHNGAGSWLYDWTDPIDGKVHAGVDGVWAVIERRMEVTKILYRKERRGVPYDEVTSRDAGFTCRARATEVAKDLPFKPTLDAAKDYFFTDKKTSKGVEGLDHVPYSVTDKGAPQLTQEIVGRMINDRIPYADKWGEFTKVTNAASMWYEGYAERVGMDGRLRTAFRQNGTRSTRYSVERINLQAIPQNYRLSEFAILDGILTPREIIAGAVPDGWRLFELDLAQAELRVGAMFAQCKLMLQMINDNEDLHTFTTKALFPEVSEDDPLFQDKWRQVGKRGNFSLQFGSQGATFRAMVSKETGIVLTEAEANRIVRDWNGLYPEYAQAIKKHQRVVERRQRTEGNAWIDTVTKERRWFQEYEEAHKAFNQRVQANLGQFAIDWMRLTERRIGSAQWVRKQAKKDGIGEAGLVLTIHDAQCLLLPDTDRGAELAEQCAERGRQLWKVMFPGVPGDVGYHLWKTAA